MEKTPETFYLVRYTDREKSSKLFACPLGRIRQALQLCVELVVEVEDEVFALVCNGQVE